MSRRFTEHISRSTTDLSGVWDFVLLGDIEADRLAPRRIEYDDAMAVPGCFDATPQYAGRRGIAAYRREIVFHDDTRHRFVFGAVHHWCRAFLLQGGEVETLGTHAGGFTGFSFDSESHAAGPAELVVLVDNRIDFDRVPTHLDYFDWYHYGGISREVELQRLGKSWIESARVETIDAESRTLKVTVACRAETSTNEHLSIRIDGTEMASAEVDVSPDPSESTYEITYPEAALWTPDEPVLHRVQVTLGADDLIDRFGIRTVAVDGSDICINGNPLRLIGFNRHESHPQFGCAVPHSIQIEDLQLIRELGCNFVRGSHYPQDPLFLDLCDELGILVWSESIGWQHTAEHFSDARFMELQKQNIGEMIGAAFNRPSVITWGLLNESDSNVEANRDAFTELIGEIRRLDPSRPVTFASHRWPKDVMHDLIDIISINTYPGWYVGEIEGIQAHLERIVGWIDDSSSAGKPIIISEIGAGAVPGFADRNEARWSEEYQGRLLETVIDALFVQSDRVCGLALWQYCDCRASAAVDRMLKRPRGFNNKGIVDEYRRPKRAFGVVKAAIEAL